MLRSSWDGYLKLSLISVPVRAYSAAVAGGGDVHFHQLHRDCGERIRYQKTCPVHGEVTKDDIVSGYEYEKGKYLELERDELTALRAEDDESITIDAFTSADQIELFYLSGKTFYLVPSGPAGKKPYALLHQVMKEKGRCGIGTVVLSGHDEVVLIHPQEKVLAMSVLFHESQLKHPAAFEDEVGAAKATAQELKLAGTLVDASTTDKIDLAQYKDQYTERTTKLLEAKLAGEKIEVRKAAKTRGVINLMDALRRSLDEKQGTKGKRSRGAAHARPARAHPARRKIA